MSSTLIYIFLQFSLYLAVYFLSGIIAIINSNDDCAPLLNIPLRIFLSAKLFLPAVKSTLQVFMVFSIKFMTPCDMLHIFRESTIRLCEYIICLFFVVKQGHSSVIASSLALVEYVPINIEKFSCATGSLVASFVSQGKKRGLL